MKHKILAVLAVLLVPGATCAGADDLPEGLQKRGFGVRAETQAQMDGDANLERVVLFARDNGHYPCFDLFKIYYAIVDEAAGTVEYLSDELLSTGRDLTVEDRDGDGRAELHLRYIEGGKFTVDERGNNLRARWVYDVITLYPDKQ